jgi:hypothetical protein
MTRREFIHILVKVAASVFLWPPVVLRASMSPVVGGNTMFVLSQNGCGRATGYAESNKIITIGSKTHVTWLDSVAQGFRVRIRTLDRITLEWSPTYTVGEAYDNHGGPALTVDSKGYLHIVYYPHHHPFRYRKSVRPNDASEWEDEIQFGSRCTYPTLVCGPDDTLYLTGRQSRDDLWAVNLYTKPPDGDWQKPTTILIAQKPGYAHFQEALAWEPDHKTLHLSCRFYDGGQGHTVGYLRSSDRGKMWERSDGTRITLPANSDTATIIAKEETGLRCGSIAVDMSGAAYIPYSSSISSPSEMWIAWLEPSGKWSRRSLIEEIGEMWPGWELSMPGGITFSSDGRVFIGLTMMKPVGLDDEKRWGHSSSEITELVGTLDGELSVQMISESDGDIPHWLPSLERSTGHNIVGVPGLVYTGGSRGANNLQIISNDVYWAECSAKVTKSKE